MPWTRSPWPAGRRVASRHRAAAGIRLPRWTADRVREPSPPYEDEGSVRESRGAVSVWSDAWWSAALSLPIDAGDHSAGVPGVAQLRLERHGAPTGTSRPPGRVELAVPIAELDAVAALLSGVIAQARRDGVLPP